MFEQDPSYGDNVKDTTPLILGFAESEGTPRFLLLVTKS